MTITFAKEYRGVIDKSEWGPGPWHHLTKRRDITAPVNENGERCPWPWEPQQMGGAPIGMYHCGYCGAMVVAGMEHLDYTDDDDDQDDDDR